MQGSDNKGSTNDNERKLKLRIYSSFDEAAKEGAAASAMQSPVERLRETVDLILRVYGVTREQLQSQRKKLHITITRNE